MSLLFFFNDTATTEIYTLSLHDALPILAELSSQIRQRVPDRLQELAATLDPNWLAVVSDPRSEEHTSELQSLTNLVCRLLLEKKKKKKKNQKIANTKENMITTKHIILTH